MKLSQLFSGQNHIEASRREEPARQTPRNTALINRQIRALTPGQTISGEIVGKNGGEVQIRLADDVVLNARVDRSLNLETGQNMTFEVKNNGSSLTLSPLFTNVATDVNVLKALDMASLPVNQASLEMTGKLMEAGLPINRNTLLQVYREVNSFPEAEIQDIVNLHRLQMPVNETNLRQMEAYRNLTHQLLQGMESVAEALPEVFDALQAAGDAAGAVKLYQEAFLLVQEGAEAGPLQENAALLPETAEAPETVIVTEDGLQSADAAAKDTGIRAHSSPIIQEEAAEGQEVGRLRMIPPDFLQEASETVEGQSVREAGLPGTGQAEQEGFRADFSEMRETLRAALSEETLNMIKELPLTEEQAYEGAALAGRFEAGEIDEKQLMQSLTRLAEGMDAKNPGAGTQALAGLFSRPAFRELLTGQMRDNWTVRPEEVAEQGKVEELYRRLDRQLKGLSRALEDVGQTGSAAYKAVSGMAQNVDFLQQINQMYAYVQLPLRLQQGEAHGELFVYTNRKHLAQSDGMVSALLHLDMEYLGPVDVYVTLQESRVSTNFRVQDEDMLNFLEQHMDLLTERLKKRGYDCSCTMTTREEAGDEGVPGGIGMLLQQEKGVALTRYAFDVRT